MVLILKKGATAREMEKINKRLAGRKSRKIINAKKYLGTIKLKEDPLVTQSKLRDEWE